MNRLLKNGASENQTGKNTDENVVEQMIPNDSRQKYPMVNAVSASEKESKSSGKKNY